MKNKKLFAILTLVCFMFTLMPVAAFAGDEVTIINVDGTDIDPATDSEVVVVDDVVTFEGTDGGYFAVDEDYQHLEQHLYLMHRGYAAGLFL